MGSMSRNKGANFERRLVNEATAVGLPADRLAPLQAGRIEGAPDVLLKTWPELHVEAKADERMSVDTMVKQAERDCLAGRVPIVVWKRNRRKVRADVPWPWLLSVLVELQSVRSLEQS